MSWTSLDQFFDFWKMLAKTETRSCSLCKGRGEAFEMGGILPPSWECCLACRGTGEAPSPLLVNNSELEGYG